MNGFQSAGGESQDIQGKANKNDAGQLYVMLMQESSTYFSLDYLSEQIYLDRDSNDNGVSDSSRQKICEWCYNIVDHFALDREIVYIAMSYFDRYISCKFFSRNKNRRLQTMSKRSVQLLGLTSLFLANKVHGYEETDMRDLHVSDFAALSGGKFIVQDIEEMEEELLSDLGWKINTPTLSGFIIEFLNLLDLDLRKSPFASIPSLQNRVKSALYEVARYIAELSVIVYHLSVRQRSSCVAFASILIAIDVVGETLIPETEIRSFKKIAIDICSQSPHLRVGEWQQEVFHVKSIMLDIFQGVFIHSNPVLQNILNSIIPPEERKPNMSKTHYRMKSPKCVSRLRKARLQHHYI